jgi:cell division protein FtsB
MSNENKSFRDEVLAELGSLQDEIKKTQEVIAENERMGNKITTKIRALISAGKENPAIFKNIPKETIISLNQSLQGLKEEGAGLAQEQIAILEEFFTLLHKYGVQGA